MKREVAEPAAGRAPVEGEVPPQVHAPPAVPTDPIQTAARAVLRARRRMFVPPIVASRTQVALS
jgi:hypothetical protein